MTNQKPNIYKLCQDMGEVRGKVDQMNDTLNRIMENHGGRINNLEKVTDQIVGKTGILSTIFGFVGGIVIALISYFLKK